MMEIDCRECVNCDVAKGNCRMYGSDPDKAIKACAAYGFENYILVGDKRVKKSLIHGTQAWRNILIDYDKMIQAPDITIEDLNRVFRYVCALESRLKRVEKERDSAVEMLYESAPCLACERKCSSMLDENYIKYCVNCYFGSEFVYSLPRPNEK